MSEHAFIYVGASRCGCIVAALVDDPKYRKETAKDVAAMIRDGCTVTRIPNPDASPFSRCDDHKGIAAHKEWLAAMKAWPAKGAAQGDLFAAGAS